MTSLPSPLYLGGNVVYALRLVAGGMLLVDAGPDLEGEAPGEDTWTQAVAQAVAHGFTPADVRLVLITHGHIDHCGLAWRWAAAGRDGAGARVLVMRPDREAVTGGRAWQDARREWRVAEFLRHGCPPALADRLGAWGRAALPGWRWDVPPETSVGEVVDGQEFALAGGATLGILAMPGHTPGNLVALLQPGGVLLSGDTLLPDTFPNPGLHFPAAGEDGGPGQRWPSLPPFLDSVGRLRALLEAGQIHRVLPGHGAPVEDARNLIDRFEAHHDRRLARVRRLLSTAPEGLTAYEVVQGQFPHLPPERTGQAMTEAIGHLDVLVARGEARWREQQGLLRATPVPGA